MNHSTLISSTLLVLLTVIGLDLQAENKKKPASRLAEAHAHNDYLHKRPLLDALDQGFSSVEADIFLVEGKLLVAHTRFELSKTRTLEGLYLKPLAERVKKFEGKIYPEGKEFQLLIDIKSKAEPTYLALRELLKKYAKIFTKVENGKVTQGAVTAVLSGNRPFETVEKQKVRWVAMDGRPSNLDSKKPAHFIPLISERWGKLFKWRGKGPFPEEEQKKLKSIIKKAHAKKRRVRFWATPEDPIVWKVLLDHKVDHINTDKLEALRKFLLKNKKREL